MKRALVLIALLLSCSPAHAAFTYVASSAKITTSNSTVSTLALTINAMGSASNMLAGGASLGETGSNNGTVSSVTDNGTGGTWVVAQNVNDTTNSQQAASVYGYGWSVTPTVVTVHFTNDFGSNAFGLMEFSGQATGDPLDSTNWQGLNTQSPGTGTDGLKSGAGTKTPSTANYLVVGIGVETGAGPTGSSFFGAGTNFTKPAGGENNVVSTQGMAMEYWIQTTATAANASWTLAANHAATALMMIFKVAGGGGAATCAPTMGTLGVSQCGD